ncbi:MAG: heparan-alpha-glucosaminide N-acetyltransferase domain-containing protein [Blastopirellula sp. JB062]
MRYSSIDCLRTIAIVVMVLVHFAENLSGVHLPITGLGAPLFVFLSGLSYRLWVNGLEQRNVSAEEISKRSIRRGLFVFGVGFGFNILVWLPEDTFNWDVLTFIGFSLLTLNLLRRLPMPVSIWIAVISALISPLLREMADYEAYWAEGYFDPDLTLSDIAIGFLATGYFPIFPWLAYSIAGLVIGTIMFPINTAHETCLRKRALSPTMETNSGLWPNARTPVLVGTSLFILSAALLAIRPYLPLLISQRYLGGWSMFPPSVEYVFATIGMASLLFGAAHLWIDRPRGRSLSPGLLDITKTFSRYSFTIYVLHHLVHLWPLWLYGAASGREATYYWEKAMLLSMALSLACVFLVICYLALRKIGPDRRLGVEGWMRWLCD